MVHLLITATEDCKDPLTPIKRDYSIEAQGHYAGGQSYFICQVAGNLTRSLKKAITGNDEVIDIEVID